VPEIAVINNSSMDDVDVQFAVEACDIQLRRDLCAAWTGLEYTPVRFYASVKDLPVASGVSRLMLIQDTIDTKGIPGAVAYHTMDVYIHGVVLGGQGMASRLSHECCEEMVDPTASAWVPMPRGGEVALEVCDPVEADEYTIEAVVMGQKREVSVSNFVYPAWFGTSTANLHGIPGKYDFLGRVPGAFVLSAGGYMVVLDPDGSSHDIWADTETPGESATRRARKVLNSTSRTWRRGVR
jgi:hypothetical protein